MLSANYDHWLKYDPEHLDEYLYHAAPTSERARIQTHGLLPAKPGLNPYWTGDKWVGRQPQGVYLSEEPQGWAEADQDRQQLDVWRVPRHQLDESQLVEDPILRHPYYVYPHPIQPELFTPYEQYGLDKGRDHPVWSSSRTYYHGTNVELEPGAMLGLTHLPTFDNAHAEYDPSKVYVTHSPSSAEGYAFSRAKRHGGEPMVYEVEPMGEPTLDPETAAIPGWQVDYTVPSARIIRRVSSDQGDTNHPNHLNQTESQTSDTSSQTASSPSPGNPSGARDLPSHPSQGVSIRKTPAQINLSTGSDYPDSENVSISPLTELCHSLGLDTWESEGGWTDGKVSSKVSGVTANAERGLTVSRPSFKALLTWGNIREPAESAPDQWKFLSTIQARSPDGTDAPVVEVSTPTDPSHESEDARPMIYSRDHGKIWMGSIGSAHHHIVNFVPELDYSGQSGIRPEGIYHGVRDSQGDHWYDAHKGTWEQMFSSNRGPTLERTAGKFESVIKIGDKLYWGSGRNDFHAEIARQHGLTPEQVSQGIFGEGDPDTEDFQWYTKNPEQTQLRMNNERRLWAEHGYDPYSEEWSNVFSKVGSPDGTQWVGFPGYTGDHSFLMGAHDGRLIIGDSQKHHADLWPIVSEAPYEQPFLAGAVYGGGFQSYTDEENPHWDRAYKYFNDLNEAHPELGETLARSHGMGDMFSKVGGTYGPTVVESQIPTDYSLMGGGDLSGVDRTGDRPVVHYHPTNTTYVGQEGQHHPDVISEHGLDMGHVDENGNEEPLAEDSPYNWTSEMLPEPHMKNFSYGLVTPGMVDPSERKFQTWGSMPDHVEPLLRQHGYLTPEKVHEREGWDQVFSKTEWRLSGRSQVEWERLRTRLDEQHGPSQSEIIHQWPDGTTVQRHSRPEDVLRVGEMMANCWKDPDRFRDHGKYFTLHDPKGRPKLAVDEQEGKLSIPLGAWNHYAFKHNGVPDGVYSTHIKRLAEALEPLGYDSWNGYQNPASSMPWVNTHGFSNNIPGYENQSPTTWSPAGGFGPPRRPEAKTSATWDPVNFRWINPKPVLDVVHSQLPPTDGAYKETGDREFRKRHPIVVRNNTLYVGNAGDLHSDIYAEHGIPNDYTDTHGGWLPNGGWEHEPGRISWFDNNLKPEWRDAVHDALNSVEDKPTWEQMFSKVAKETPNQKARRWERIQAHFPDNSKILDTTPEGWTIRHLPTYGDAARTGLIMNNCWKGAATFSNPSRPFHANMTHTKHSLNDESGMPLVAFMVKRPMDGQMGEVQESLAARNKPPLPGHEDAIKAWAQKNGYNYRVADYSNPLLHIDEDAPTDLAGNRFDAKVANAAKIVEEPEALADTHPAYLNRRAFIYQPSHHTIYVGGPGYHHPDVNERFALPWERNRIMGVYATGPSQGFGARDEAGIDLVGMPNREQLWVAHQLSQHYGVPVTHKPENTWEGMFG